MIGGFVVPGLAGTGLCAGGKLGFVCTGAGGGGPGLIGGFAVSCMPGGRTGIVPGVGFGLTGGGGFILGGGPGFKVFTGGAGAGLVSIGALVG